MRHRERTGASQAAQGKPSLDGERNNARDQARRIAALTKIDVMGISSNHQVQYSPGSPDQARDGPQGSAAQPRRACRDHGQVLAESSDSAAGASDD